jgi:hypothetical protein
LTLNAGFTGNTLATDLMTSKPDFFQNCVIPAPPNSSFKITPELVEKNIEFFQAVFFLHADSELPPPKKPASPQILPRRLPRKPNPRAAALPKVSIADQILGAPISKARGFRGVAAASFSPRGSAYLAAALGACVSQPSASARHAAH